MPEIQIEKLCQKHEEAKNKLASFEKSDKDAWHKYKAELDDLVDDIDDDLRSALAYFG